MNASIADFQNALTTTRLKQFRKWAGLGVKDGQLLLLAEVEFDAFITVDRSLPFQQNLRELSLFIVVLHVPSNRLADLRPLASDILDALAMPTKGQYAVVEKTN